MTLSDLFRAARRLLKSTRRSRHDFQSLAHLDARLLRDIGLRLEHGVVMPFADDDSALGQAVSPVRDSREEAWSPPKLCPRCGEPLT
ncbi:hypothetical protein GCM10027040_08460 [Halomonas shantousis]